MQLIETLKEEKIRKTMIKMINQKKERDKR